MIANLWDEVQLGGGGGLPGIQREIAAGDGVGVLLAEGAQGRDIELEMARRVRGEICGGEVEEAHGGAQASAVL